MNSGAWCPSSQIGEENSGREWIQVNFTEPQVITKLATQGRFGNGMGVEFVEQYGLHYSRDGGVTWIRWHHRDGPSVSLYFFCLCLFIYGIIIS